MRKVCGTMSIVINCSIYVLLLTEIQNAVVNFGWNNLSVLHRWDPIPIKTLPSPSPFLSYYPPPSHPAHSSEPSSLERVNTTLRQRSNEVIPNEDQDGAYEYSWDEIIAEKWLHTWCGRRAKRGLNSWDGFIVEKKMNETMYPVIKPNPEEELTGILTGCTTSTAYCFLTGLVRSICTVCIPYTNAPLSVVNTADATIELNT